MKIVGCDLHTRYQQIAMLDHTPPRAHHPICRIRSRMSSL
jgi:hypothetical protein